jgi:hypothetical protein
LNLEGSERMSFTLIERPMRVAMLQCCMRNNNVARPGDNHMITGIVGVKYTFTSDATSSTEINLR